MTKPTRIAGASRDLNVDRVRMLRRARISMVMFALVLSVPAMLRAQTSESVATVAPEANVSAPIAPAPDAGGGGGGGVSDSTGPSALILAARAAHQKAWSQRDGGDFAASVQTAEASLATLDQALEGDLDASTRREIVELRGRIAGLRDAARGDLEAKTDDKKSDKSEKDKDKDDDASDPKVLNAPAIDDLRPQMNGDVHRYIEVFTGAGRSTFERWLKRSGRYMQLFREVLRREGMPPDLVHLVFVESGFNVHAKSVSAAVGPWQFLRSTGRLYGLTVNQWIDE